MPESMNWQDIAAVLRERIQSGQLKPGQKFPTNMELMKEFGVYVSTIQNAVNALIREGLVISPGSGNKRRLVRPLNERSTRRGGFLTEFGSRAKIDILEMKVVRSAAKLPPGAAEVLRPPVLVFKTRQWRDNIPVALSCSYIPGTLPVKELKSLLAKQDVDLYMAMKTLGLKPATCEESLIAAAATPEEERDLHGSPIVVRITRKVFDEYGNLLELCYLTDRADCYEFVYRFPCE